jgi:RNA polymerase sigma-70 factor (ECF subfamily)
MDKMISDYELITRFVKGDERCFEELIDRHKNKVFSYINLYIRDQTLAEDIFQDTFLKVIQSVKSGKYYEDGKFLSWVMRIAHNLIIDNFRRVKQLNVVSNDGCELDLFNSSKLSDTNIEDDYIKKQIKKDIRSMIGCLPDEQREVVMLRHYADMSFKEIADITGVSINTALGRMRYALVNLRKIMAEKKINLTIN